MASIVCAVCGSDTDIVVACKGCAEERYCSLACEKYGSHLSVCATSDPVNFTAHAMVFMESVLGKKVEGFGFGIDRATRAVLDKPYKVVGDLNYFVNTPHFFCDKVVVNGKVWLDCALGAVLITLMHLSQEKNPRRPITYTFPLCHTASTVKGGPALLADADQHGLASDMNYSLVLHTTWSELLDHGRSVHHYENSAQWLTKHPYTPGQWVGMTHHGFMSDSLVGWSDKLCRDHAALVLKHDPDHRQSLEMCGLDEEHIAGCATFLQCTAKYIMKQHGPPKVLYG